jgi:D-arabinose 1-dehydrogenase-like Zn-dependent alcohol dehydrogenase
MRAARFVAPGEPLAITSVARPTAGPGESLIRVRAVGLCGSDVHITEGHTPTAFTPITLGHEIAGVVEEVLGDSCVSPGDHVFVNPMVGCGRCRSCARGRVNFCARRQIIGIQLDGALAEYVVAPTANLTVIPRHVGFPEIALVESAGTSNHAVRALDVAPGDVIVVIGAGGLGMQALRIALARGAEVHAVDTYDLARERCAQAGASGAFDPTTTGLASVIRERAGRADGVDGVIDCVGNQATFTTALHLLRVNGHCAVVGIGATPLELTPPAHFMRRALRVSGIYGYTSQDIAEVVGRLVDGTLDLRASVSAVLPLDRVNDGLRMVADRSSSPVRVVIEP